LDKVDFPNIFDGIFLCPVPFPGGLEHVLCALPWGPSDYYLFSTVQKSNNGKLSLDCVKNHVRNFFEMHF